MLRLFQKGIYVFFLLILVSCSGAKTEIHSQIDVANYQVCKLNIYNDSWNLRRNFTKRIENLGCDVVDLSTNKEPDIEVNIDYETYWDVIHQTFTYFNIHFINLKTGKYIASSRYVGRVGFNDCDAALDIVFEDLSKKIIKR